MGLKDFFFTKPEDRYESPEIRLGNLLLVILPICLIAFLAVNAYYIVPPSNVGIKISLGQIDLSHSYPEGFKWKTPIMERYINMPINIQSVTVTESTASEDIQEVTTKLSVQYKLNGLVAPQVYRDYGRNPDIWESTQIIPVLLEEMKSTTADWTAEELIQERPLVIEELWEHLTTRLGPLGFIVISVNIEDMQFSEEFTQAIEDKVVATQQSLAEKNRVEIVRYQQLQQILQKQGEANRTIIEATANAEKIKINANADAYQIEITYNATAKGITQIRGSLTDEYLQYLMIGAGWDGELPLIIGSDGSMFLDVRTLLESKP